MQKSIRAGIRPDINTIILCEETKTMSKTSQKLVKLRIIGGFLDGFDFDFSENLNCIIGARGTGKTTVLEFVRYALNVMPTDPKRRRELVSLVESNLIGGRIEITLETSTGIRYIVSRTVGAEPEVYDADHKGTGLTFTGNIFRIDIFSQNEIETIAGQNACQMALIDAFAQDEINKLGSDIDQVRKALEANAAAIIPLHEREKRLEEDLNLMPQIKSKLAELSAVDAKESTELNLAHEQKNIRSLEKTFVASIEKAYIEVSNAMKPLTDVVTEQLRWCKTEAMTAGENFGLVQEIYNEFQSNEAVVKEVVDVVIQKLRASYGRCQTKKKTLFAKQQEQDMGYNALVEKNQEEQMRAAERRKFSDQYTALVSEQNELDALRTKIADAVGEREKLKNVLTHLEDKRFGIRWDIADRINSNLNQNIRVTVTQCGSTDMYCDLLVNWLKGAQMQYKQVANAISKRISPTCLVEYVTQESVEDLRKYAELNPNQAKAVVSMLNKPEILFTLEVVPLPDTIKIELNDHGTYKQTETLSTGQKCNAILPILLLDSERPLLIDQPEDNLDNEFVHNIIVESVQNVKKSRQLIFVTHNPNIPVLSDSEQVIVMESNGKAGHIRKSGTVDDCKSNIINILEGGEEAFKKRVNRYMNEVKDA